MVYQNYVKDPLCSLKIHTHLLLAIIACSLLLHLGQALGFLGRLIELDEDSSNAEDQTEEPAGGRSLGCLLEGYLWKRS